LPLRITKNEQPDILKCQPANRVNYSWEKVLDLIQTWLQFFALLSRASLIFLVLITGVCVAQNSLEQLRQNLDNGYYASAAQISGPGAISENSTNPEAYFLYSKALYYTEDFLLARTQFDKVMSLTSSPTPDYIHLNGLITAAEGNLTEAVTLLETAFLRSQNYLMAMDWGRIAWQGGDFDTALKAYEAASTTEQGQKELSPHLNRGRILQLFKGDNEAAITAYKNALTIFDENDPGDDVPVPPGVVEANFRLGEIYESLGDNATAKSYYDAALFYDRNYTPAQNALTRLLRNP
jgi:tetratricopeptide (TPR) repeat protein